MNAITILVASVALLAFAGCIDDGATDEAYDGDVTTPLVPGADDAPPGDDGLQPATPVRTVLNWTGYLKVGAADEAPSHVQETGAATGGVWSPSFHYEVVQVPQELEIRLDWSATAAQIEFMVTLPEGDAIYETDFVDHGPLCARIPADKLVPGTYAIMAHSRYAVDAKLMFSVSSMGGETQIIDHAHSAPASEFPGYIVALATGGGGESARPEACEPPA